MDVVKKSAIPPEAARIVARKGDNITGEDPDDISHYDDEGQGKDGQDDDNGDDDVQGGGSGNADNSQYYTIALHSRHIDISLDGCDISTEMKCMNQLLSSKMPAGNKCAVAVMSDRSCTISMLLPWLEERGCHAYVARHDNRTYTDVPLEHGPFAGAGFYQDMALATALTRSAVVGWLHRSSTGLVLALIQFYRTMEAWKQSDDPRDWTLQRTMVDLCDLKFTPYRRYAIIDPV
jgi:hypothetical protein